MDDLRPDDLLGVPGGGVAEVRPDGGLRWILEPAASAPGGAETRVRPGADLTGCVLAGGRSTRFGGDKRRAIADGRDLLTLSYERLRTVAPRVLLSVARGEAKAHPTFPEVVEDVAEDAGPLAGILAALAVARTPLVAFTPVDMPDLPADVIRALAVLGGTRGAVACDGYGPIPLLVVLPASARAGLEAAFAAGETSMARLLDATGVVRVGVDVIARLGNPARVFRNVNRPEDL